MKKQVEQHPDALESLQEQEWQRKEHQYATWQRNNPDEIWLESCIIEEKMMRQKVLKLITNSRVNWANLVYRTSIDGPGAGPWHEICEGRAPTLTLVRGQNGRVFGGYTDIPWSTPDDATR